MHEWALAESIVYYILDQGFKTVRRLRLKLGVLQSIDREVLTFSLKEIASMSNLELGELVIEEEEPELKCNTCGYTWRIELNQLSDAEREAVHFIPESIHAFTRCPKCGSRDFTIIKGRGVSIAEVVPG
ncbi:MAG: hydrogenase nickel incorporation protein HypA [Desulfurococcus sp.]|nr:hydrogenase nickel incorporation protein HypA [Desulfurococcus sp.]